MNAAEDFFLLSFHGGMKIDFHRSSSMVLNEKFSLCFTNTHRHRWIHMYTGGEFGELRCRAAQLVLSISHFSLSFHADFREFSSKAELFSSGNFTSGDFSSSIFWLIRFVSMVTHTHSFSPSLDHKKSYDPFGKFITIEWKYGL
jgi:hypothetical protein